MTTLSKYRRDWNGLDFVCFQNERESWRRIVQRFRELDRDGLLIALALGIRDLRLDSDHTAARNLRIIGEGEYGWELSEAECRRVARYAYSDCAEWRFKRDLWRRRPRVAA